MCVNVSGIHQDYSFVPDVEQTRDKDRFRKIKQVSWKPVVNVPGRGGNSRSNQRHRQTPRCSMIWSQLWRLVALENPKYWPTLMGKSGLNYLLKGKLKLFKLEVIIFFK